MIIAKVLNSEASLNNFTEISNVEFIPGEQVTIVVRLYDTQRSLRYVPPATNTTTFTLNKSDGTTLEKSGSYVDSDDRSLISFTLSETETADLVGGNIIFELDILGDTTYIRKGIIRNAISRVVDGSEC